MLKKLLAGLALLFIACNAHAQQTLSCGSKVDSFTNAVIADLSIGTSYALQSNLLYLSWQVSYASAPSAVQIELQASLDNANWAVIDTSTTTAGSVRTVSGAQRFIRAFIASHTGGSGITVSFNCTKQGSTGNANIVFEDEGSGLIRRNIVNFAGNGVVCVDDTTKTTCTISGLAGAAYGTIEDEGIVLTQRSNINFVGSGVSCVDSGGKTVCTITGGGGGASFPLQGGTGCTVPEHGFAADTDSGMCLNAANDVRVQTAPLTTASSSAIALSTTGAGLNFYNASSQQNGATLTNGAFTVTLLGDVVLQSTRTSPHLQVGNTTYADPIDIVLSTATPSHKGNITSLDLTATRTWTFPDASGTVNLVAIGSAAPPGASCDFSSEVGSLYTQSGAWSAVNGQTFVCAQIDGVPTYAWMPIGHLAGTAHPAVCSVGNIFFDTNSAAGSNLELCTAANTWTVVAGGGGGGFSSPGQGIIVDTVGDGTLAARSLAAGEGIIITNPLGTAGNPTIAIDKAVVTSKGSGTADPPACGDTGDAFQIGDLYYETDTFEVSSCTGIDTWLCINCSSINPATTIDMLEECIMGNNTSGGQGTHGMTSAAIAGGTVTMNASGVAGHPGLCEVQTSTTDNAGGRWEFVGTATGAAWHPQTWTSESWNMDAIIRYSNVAGTGFAFGVQNAGTLETTSAMIVIARDTDLSHTFFVFRVCDSATTGCQSAGDDTNQDSELSTVVPSNGDWFRARIAYDAVNVRLSFQIDNETPVTFCASGCTSTMANLPTAGANMRPIVTAQTRDTTAKNIDIDYWKVRVDYVTARY